MADTPFRRSNFRNDKALNPNLSRMIRSLRFDGLRNFNQEERARSVSALNNLNLFNPTPNTDDRSTNVPGFGLYSAKPVALQTRSQSPKTVDQEKKDYRRKRAGNVLFIQHTKTKHLVTYYLISAFII